MGIEDDRTKSVEKDLTSHAIDGTADMHHPRADSQRPPRLNDSAKTPSADRADLWKDRPTATDSDERGEQSKACDRSGVEHRPSSRADAEPDHVARRYEGDPLADRTTRSADKLTSKECSQVELKEVAKAAFPQRFHETIDRSQILAVQKAERYNTEVLNGKEKYRNVEQTPARERDTLNVVELKLGADLPAGQAHSLDRLNPSNPYFGSWFSEHSLLGQTQADVREAAALPMNSPDKTHATVGRITAGSTVVISEVAPRSYDLSDLIMEKHPWSASKSETGALVETPPRDAPPLADALPVRAFQIELRHGRFEPDGDHKPWLPREHELTKDRWH